jgi:hypothetical protein
MAQGGEGDLMAQSGEGDWFARHPSFIRLFPGGIDGPNAEPQPVAPRYRGAVPLPDADAGPPGG